MTRLGSIVLRFDTISSTNDYAREMAANGAEEGVAILACEQRAGRGRQGRGWASPAGEGLYLSLILRPEISPARSSVITLASAIAVAETLALDFNAAVDIKWPNDILASGKKICGILVESAIEKDHIQYAVLGIGINLAQREFPEAIRDSATSLLMETGQTVAPDDLSSPLFDRLEHWYRIAIGQPDEIIARWEELSSYAHDRAVRVESSDEVIEGITRGLAPSGALIVETGGGKRREIVSGEVRLRASSQQLQAVNVEKEASG